MRAQEFSNSTHWVLDIMDQQEKLAQWEDEEGTFLEKSWGHRLKVPCYSVDDSGLYNFGKCEWDVKLPFHHLIIKPKDNFQFVPIYQNSYSWKISRVAYRDEIMVAKCAPVFVDGWQMIPIEGGGAVPFRQVRAATGVELDLNPVLQVIDIDTVKPKMVPNDYYYNIGRALLFWHLLGWTFQLEPQPEFTDDCLGQSLWNLGCKVKRESKILAILVVM